MTQIRLVITLPEHLWAGDVTRAYPDSTFTVLAGAPSDDVGVGLVRITGPDIESLLSAIESYDQITELSIIQQSDSEATLQLETTMPLLQLSAQASGLPIEMPVTIRDGKATVDATGSHERISELGDQLRNFGLEFQIEYIQERLHTSQLLSEKQQELVLAAVDCGYYDTPRGCTLTELAETVGIAKSTCSETLHRAEETMIKHFVDDLPTPIEKQKRIVTPE